MYSGRNEDKCTNETPQLCPACDATLLSRESWPTQRKAQLWHRGTLSVNNIGVWKESAWWWWCAQTECENKEILLTTITYKKKVVKSLIQGVRLTLTDGQFPYQTSLRMIIIIRFPSLLHHHFMEIQNAPSRHGKEPSDVHRHPVLTECTQKILISSTSLLFLLQTHRLPAIYLAHTIVTLLQICDLYRVLA